MSRLLFAAARSARIQYEWYGQWKNTNTAPLDSGTQLYRIHPDDEHLQYGPISTAFREAAENPPQFPDIPFRQGMFYCPQSQLSFYFALDTFGKSIACLLLAEYLADEGL